MSVTQEVGSDPSTRMREERQCCTRPGAERARVAQNHRIRCGGRVVFEDFFRGMYQAAIGQRCGIDSSQVPSLEVHFGRRDIWWETEENDRFLEFMLRPGLGGQVGC